MVTTAPLQGLAEEHLQIRIPPRTLTKEDNTGVVYPAAQGRGYANEPPELASEVLEREKGFEPSTLALARRCSTPEPHPHIWWSETESNRRHEDFQSSALPTELSDLLADRGHYIMILND